MSTFERVDALVDPGIEPVEPRRRVLSGIDLAILWGDLGIGLLVLVTGGLLVPGLGFGDAMVAIVLGSAVGVALLSLAASAGAQHGVPTMVLLRPVLGIRGSWVPSALNTVQLIGWTAVEFWAISLVADIVSDRVFGFSARPFWLVITVLVCLGLALWGPVGVTRTWMKRFGAWATAGICLMVTVMVLATDGAASALAADGQGGWPTVGSALDLVIAMPVSWLPLVADYTRFGTGARPAFVGTFTGYFVANVWLYALGALLVLVAGAVPDPAGVAVAILAVAGGSLAGFVFLVGLLVGETDEAFADIYSGSVSLQNIAPRVSLSVFTVVIVLLSGVLALWLNMARYEAFLFLIGSLFVPLFGVLVADHFVNRRGRIDLTSLYDPHGRYSYTKGLRFAALIPWLVGFSVYHWINPGGLPAWWTDMTATFLGAPLIDTVAWMPASIPSFTIAFLLALLLPRVSWPRAPSIEGEPR